MTVNCLQSVQTAWMVLLLAMWSPCAHVRDATSADRDAAAVQPIVSESTFLVVKVDPSENDPSQFPAAILSGDAETRAAYEQWAALVGRGLDWLATIMDRQALYSSHGVATSSSHWPSMLSVKSTPTLNAESARSSQLLASDSSVRAGRDLVASPRDGEDVTQTLGRLPAAPAQKCLPHLRLSAVILSKSCCCRPHTCDEPCKN